MEQAELVLLIPLVAKWRHSQDLLRMVFSLTAQLQLQTLLLHLACCVLLMRLLVLVVFAICDNFYCFCRQLLWLRQMVLYWGLSVIWNIQSVVHLYKYSWYFSVDDLMELWGFRHKTCRYLSRKCETNSIWFRWCDSISIECFCKPDFALSKSCPSFA